MLLQNGARAQRSPINQINQHSVCPSLPAVWPEACHFNSDYHDSTRKPIGDLPLQTRSVAQHARRWGVFLALYAVLLLELKWLSPGYMETVWNRSGLIAWRPAGLPPEELLFGFGFGLYWSTVYQHVTWRQSDAVGHRVANANRKLEMTKTLYRGSDSAEGGQRE